MEGRRQERTRAAARKADRRFVANFKTSFDYVIRFVLQSPQTTIQNLASEIIDFKRADVVEIRDSAKNLFASISIARLICRSRCRFAGPNQTRSQRRTVRNWHKFQGVMTPLVVTRSTDGVKTMEIPCGVRGLQPRPCRQLFTQLTAPK